MYPGYEGQSTRSLSPPDAQPPTVLQRGPVDETVEVTAAQADHFVRHGCVIIEGLIPEEQLERWRSQFWDVIGADPNDSSCLLSRPPVGTSTAPTHLKVRLRRQVFVLHTYISASVHRLLLRFCASMRTRCQPRLSVLTNIAMHNTTGGWVGGCAIVASTYIFDVTAKGGGTCFFPGDHTAVGNVFEDEPRQFIT
jgi:hypothetical protein